MRKSIRVMSIALGTLLLLSGCSGRTTDLENTTETADQSAAAEKVEEAGPVQIGSETAIPEEADKAHLRRQLDKVAAQPRPSGSEGEKKAADYIYGYLEKLGYETSQQKFTQKSLEEGKPDVSGINVIGVKKADQDPDQADILIVSAHHDGKPGIEGACDNASGVAVMMEAAYLVRNLATDTEVRFISFAGEEDGRIGSRYYVEQMPAQERARVIGDIQLDEIGYINSDYLVLGTVDAAPTYLGDLLSEKAKKTRNVGQAIPYHQDVMSDHHSFAAHGIPAVLLGQDASTYESHSVMDTVDILDLRKLTQTAQLVADVAADLMSEDTPSCREEAYRESPARTGFYVGKTTQLYFGLDRNFVENQMAHTGVLDRTEVNEYGDTVEYYRYPVRWFDMDEAIDSVFTYRNQFLEQVTIPFAEATGKTMDEARDLIALALGEQPMKYPADLGTEYDWEDAAGHKFYSLAPGENGTYQLMVLDFNPGRTLGETYDLSRGFDGLEAASEADGKLLELLAGLIYPEDLPMMRFIVYTDGLGNSTGFSGGISEEDNTLMEYALDSVDAIDGDGQWRDYHKTIRTAVHEYGHVLSLNSGQVDMKKQNEGMPAIFFPTETYSEDSYIRAYYGRFWDGMDVKTGLEAYKERPEDFVSAYGATDLSEDFAESFMLFMLGNEPDGDSVAQEKIRFFYDYPELMARRDYVRMNLGIADPADYRDRIPQKAEENYRIELDGNPTTGYSWDYKAEPEGIVTEAVNDFHRGNLRDTDLVGSGGTYVFEFAGAQEGTALVTFTYSRPWEPKAGDRKRVFELTVDAGKKVTGREITEDSETAAN